MSGNYIAVDFSKPAPPRLEATLLKRNDGKYLLYAGQLHTFYGHDSEGKTWLAIEAARQAIAQRKHVLYLDFEEPTEDQIRDRITAISLDELPDWKTYFHYYNVIGSYGKAEKNDLEALLDTVQIELGICDGVAEACAYEDKNENDGLQYLQWLGMLPRKLAHKRAAVVMIDHPSRANQRASGTKKKQNAITVDYNIVLGNAFSRGISGDFKIIVKKDKNGFQKKETTYTVDVICDPSDDSIRFDIGGGSADVNTEKRADKNKEKIKVAVMGVLYKEHPKFLSTAAVVGAVTGRRETTLWALESLFNSDHIEKEPHIGRGGGFEYRWKRFYESATSSPTVPVPVPESAGTGLNGSGTGDAANSFPVPEGTGSSTNGRVPEELFTF